MGFIGNKVLQRLDLRPMPADEPVAEILPEVTEPAPVEPQWAPADR